MHYAVIIMVKISRRVCSAVYWQPLQAF